MDFLDFAAKMFPFWAIGLGTFFALKKSEHKDLLKIDYKAIAKFLIFMGVLSAWRIFSIKTAMSLGGNIEALKSAKIIPLGAILFVWWEDLCHSLPLVILKRVLPKNKWINILHKILLVFVMAVFSIGHLYQGALAAVVISLYIPLSMSIGEKKGYGTLMICHILYDLITILAVRYALG